METNVRVLVTGGGTGGHVNPAIAIANSIRDNIDGSVIEFVGTSRGIENKLVPKEGYKLHHIEIQGIRRSLSPSNIKTLWLAFTSVFKAEKLIKEFKPDLVVGTGGYVSWPIVKAASKLGIPSALHESNAVPGFAVKMLEKHVDKIYVNFEDTLKSLEHPEKAVRVGNPLRGGFVGADRNKARKSLGITGKYKYFMLSCGGSMGAEPINNAVLDFMRDYATKHPELLCVHATGALEYEAAKQKFEEYGLDKYENIQLLEYIYDMPIRMAAADIVINRAGAMTLSELAMSQKPSILIPSPYVTNNHQYKNAKVLADANAAILIEEKDLKPTTLPETVDALFNTPSKLSEMSENVKQFAVPDASEKLLAELVKLARKN